MANVIKCSIPSNLIDGWDKIDNCMVVRFRQQAKERFGEYIKLPMSDLHEFDYDGESDHLNIEVFKGTKTADYLIYDQYNLLR